MNLSPIIKNNLSILNWRLWLPISFLVSLFYFYLFLDLRGLNENWYVIENDDVLTMQGDSPQYIGAVEEYIKNDNYLFLEVENWGIYSRNADFKKIRAAFRTPGFMLTYYPIRLFTDRHTACKAFLVIQTIVFSFAIYAFGLIVFLLFKSNKIAVLTLLGCFFYPNLYEYNIMIYSESLGLSTMLLSLYFIINKKKSYLNIFIAGVFFLIAFYMRSFLIVPLIGISGILFFISFKKNKSIFRGIKTSIVFLLPFLIVHSFWVSRNFIKVNEIIPIASTYEFLNQAHPSFVSIRKYSVIDGQNIEYWGSTPSSWFINSKTSKISESGFSERILSDNRQVELILKARLIYHDSKNKSYSIGKALLLEKESNEALIKAISFYENDNYWQSKFLYRFTTFKNLLVNQRKIRLYSSLRYPFNVIFSAKSSFMSFLTFFVGVFGGLFLISRILKSPKLMIMFISPFFIVFLFWLEGTSEVRELFLCIPFFILGGISFLFEKNGPLWFNMAFKPIVLVFLIIAVYFDINLYVNF